MRGVFMGSAIFAMWIANFLISLAFPLLLASVGLPGAFLSFALIGIFSGIFVVKCVPETRNRSLEQIEHYLHERLGEDNESRPSLAAAKRQAASH